MGREEGSKQEIAWWVRLFSASAPVALVLAGWAHSTLWSHETRLGNVEIQQTADDRRVSEQLADLKAAILRIESKLDARATPSEDLRAKWGRQ